jgi:hypothetical protein
LEIGAVVLLVVGVLIAYLGNQLPPVSQFSGRNWLLVRLLLWSVLIAIAIQSLSQKTSDGVVIGLWCAIAAAAVAMIYDGSKLIGAIRRTEAVVNNSPDPSRASSDRNNLLKEARRQVRQRLDYAVGDQALINLVMEPQQEAVEGHRYQGNVFLMPQPRKQLENFANNGLRLVESEETILETFEHEDIAGQLLILGAPGSGKTTTLLKLAESLLARAEGMDDIPYIFELSAWRDDRQDIASWLMAQLKFEHNIDEVVSREWLVKGQLLPLLDGLDELEPSRQPACIAKINEFVTSQLGRQVVVCCRVKSYEAIEDSGVKLDSLNGALRLQPLTEGQIQAYFENIERPKIWQALQNEAGLGVLLQSPASDTEETAPLKIPLFLQMLAVAYQDGQTVTTEAELFDSYIAKRLDLGLRKQDRRRARKKEIEVKWAYAQIEDEPETEITKRYLAWLARQLKNNNSPNNFLIEYIQPSWMPEKNLHRRYTVLVGLLSCMLTALIIFLSIGLSDTWEKGWASALFFGLITGFSVFLGESTSIIRPVEIFKLSRSQEVKKNDIREFFEHIFRSSKSGAKFGFVTGLIYLIVVIIIRLMGDLTIKPLFSNVRVILLACLLGGTILGAFFGLFDGLVSRMMDELKVIFVTREKPNQGIWASAKNCLKITFVSYLFVTLISHFVLRSDFVESLSLAAIFSIYFGFYKGGGFPVVQHAVLRFLLCRQGHIPHNYAQFLRYTTERRLTQQIGGRFRFIHRELLDHFADMEECRRSN